MKNDLCVLKIISENSDISLKTNSILVNAKTPTLWELDFEIKHDLIAKQFIGSRKQSEIQVNFLESKIKLNNLFFASQMRRYNKKL